MTSDVKQVQAPLLESIDFCARLSPQGSSPETGADHAAPARDRVEAYRLPNQNGPDEDP